jgi:hypothetical protein
MERRLYEFEPLFRLTDVGTHAQGNPFTLLQSVYEMAIFNGYSGGFVDEETDEPLDTWEGLTDDNYQELLDSVLDYLNTYNCVDVRLVVKDDTIQVVEDIGNGFDPYYREE